MPVKDYSTDPDMNTTISGINIAEGCAPSGINNAIRQLMADVKAEKEERDATQAAQDAAIAGKLDTSGGTLTGNLSIGSAGTIGSSNNSDYHALWIDRNNSNAIGIFASDSPTHPGALFLRAAEAGRMSDLWLFPDGTAELAGDKIFTSAGGTLGRLQFNVTEAIARTVNNDKLIICGGQTAINSAHLALHSGELDGDFWLVASDNRGRKDLIGTTQGYLTWGGATVLTLVASGADSDSWYRKYSDGLIIQGGRVTVDTASITFDIPFTSENFAFVPGRSSSEENTGGLSIIAEPVGTTGVTLKYRHSNISNLKNGSWVKFSWIAVGY